MFRGMTQLNLVDTEAKIGSGRYNAELVNEAQETKHSFA